MKQKTTGFGFTHENTESEVLEIIDKTIKPYKEKFNDAVILVGQNENKLYYFIKQDAITTVIITLNEKEVLFDIESTNELYRWLFSLLIKMTCCTLKSAKPT